jgi:hypothetical protein
MKIYVAEADLGIQHISLYQSDVLSTGQLIIGSSRDKFLFSPTSPNLIIKFYFLLFFCISHLKVPPFFDLILELTDYPYETVKNLKNL